MITLFLFELIDQGELSNFNGDVIPNAKTGVMDTFLFFLT